LEVQRVDRVPARARIVGSGAALVVPLRSTEEDTGQAGALALRFAHRGQRLFTVDDARLADRVVDQLRRAVAYDQAVERGRSEERLRIAQDLHDDIGARLLTLMYQAQTREMEDYIRHTLQDLKTLTRGLAASEHRLSHAAAEWKADLTQRLAAAHATLGWSFEHDRDLLLSVVQWSALTRVLRELVSNALYHGHAGRIEVDFVLQGGVLTLQVVDDGEGADPQAWAHGLGLGGVRKRVKLLGGQVAWRENRPRGIACAVRVPDFSGRI
jgi:signal transduction histidine kinase